MIFQLCLFMLLSLGSADTLTLYAAPPTTPEDVKSSPCCLPKGEVSFLVTGQGFSDSEVFDIVEIQAAEWEGLGCVIYNVTESTWVNALSFNVSTYYNGNTFRIISDDSTNICETMLYESSPYPLGILYPVLYGLFSGLSILACLWLFLRYYKTPTKSLSLQLILVVSISDLMYHIFSFTNLFLNVNNIDSSILGNIDSLQGIFDDINIFIMYFSMCWSATISLIFMKALSNNALFRQLTAKTWILCLLPSLILAACLLIISIKVPAVNATWDIDVVFVIPPVVTIFCYIRAIMVLQKNPFGFKTSGKALFLYPSVQGLWLLTMALEVLIYINASLSYKAKLLMVIVLNLFRQLVGLSNAIIYLLQNRRVAVLSVPENKRLSIDSEFTPNGYAL